MIGSSPCTTWNEDPHGMVVYRMPKRYIRRIGWHIYKSRGWRQPRLGKMLSWMDFLWRMLPSLTTWVGSQSSQARWYWEDNGPNLLDSTTSGVMPNYLLVSTLLYGCKSWHLDNATQKKLRGFHSRCLDLQVRASWGATTATKPRHPVTDTEKTMGVAWTHSPNETLTDGEKSVL